MRREFLLSTVIALHCCRRTDRKRLCDVGCFLSQGWSAYQSCTATASFCAESAISHAIACAFGQLVLVPLYNVNVEFLFHSLKPSSLSSLGGCRSTWGSEGSAKFADRRLLQISKILKVRFLDGLWRPSFRSCCFAVGMGQSNICSYTGTWGARSSRQYQLDAKSRETASTEFTAFICIYSICFWLLLLPFIHVICYILFHQCLWQSSTWDKRW